MAPALYAAWTARLCRLLDAQMGASWCSEHASIFADDTLGFWEIRSVGDMRRSVKELSCLIRTLKGLGLEVNLDKSSILLSLSGVDKQKMLRAFSCVWRGKLQLRVPCEDGHVYIPLEDTVVYLGIVLNYASFESATLKHRLTKAHQRFGQLRKVLRTNSSFGPVGRRRVYVACVWSSVRYGLCAVGITQSMYNELVSALASHLRKVLRVYERGVTNLRVLARAGLDPQCELLQATERLRARLEMDSRSGQAKRREMQQIDINLQRLRGAQITQPGSSLIEIESTQGLGHCCDVSGLSFGSPEGLSMHVKHRHGDVHLDSGVPYNKGLFALFGVPICRLCRGRMYDWSSLRKHVSSGQCSRLKRRTALGQSMDQMWRDVLEEERQDPPCPPEGLAEGSAVSEVEWLDIPLSEVLKNTEAVATLRQSCSMCRQRLISVKRIKTH